MLLLSTFCYLALTFVWARNIARVPHELADVCTATELIETEIEELVIGLPIAANTSIASTGLVTICQGLTISISDAPTFIDTTFTLYETFITTETNTFTISNGITYTPPQSSPLTASQSLPPTLTGYYYFGGSSFTTLSLSGGDIVSKDAVIIATPVASSDGIDVALTHTTEIAYSGLTKTSITLFTTSPTAGSDGAFLVVETPSPSPTGPASASLTAPPSYCYYGGASVTTFSIAGQNGSPASNIIATPCSQIPGAVITLITTITIPYSGASTTSVTLLSGTPTAGQDTATLIVETPTSGPSPGSNYFYYGGQSVTTLSYVGASGPTTIVASPVSSSTNVNVVLTSTIQIQYGGTTTTSITLFSASPTPGTDNGILVIETPAPIPPANSGYFYIGGTTVTTLVVTGSDSQATTIIATPVSITGISANLKSSITVGYGSATTTSLTIFTTSPTAGADDAFLLVETPYQSTSAFVTPSASSSPASVTSAPASTVPASLASGFYYLGGSTIATLVTTGADGKPTTIVASPVTQTTDIQAVVTSTVTAGYNGASTTTITLFASSPTPGPDNAVIVVETPAGVSATTSVIEPTTESGYFYLGGSTVTTVTLTGPAGHTTLIVANPVTASSGIIPVYTSIATVQYAGTSVASLTFFTPSPTPGSDDALLIVQQPSATLSPISGQTSGAATSASGSGSIAVTPSLSGSSGASNTTSPSENLSSSGLASGMPSSGSVPLITLSPSSSVVTVSPSGTPPLSTTISASAGQDYFYIGGTTITTVTLLQSGTSVIVTASPVLNSNQITPIYTATITAPYSGTGSSTITLFSVSPTPGSDAAFLVIQTPTAAPSGSLTNSLASTPTSSAVSSRLPSSLGSSSQSASQTNTASNPLGPSSIVTPTSSASPSFSYFYIGDSTVTTLTSVSGSSTLVSIVATPVASTSGVIVEIITTVTLPYAGPTSTSLTVFTSAPTAGTDVATLIVETPTSSIVTLSTGSISSSAASVSSLATSSGIPSFYYIGGSTTTIIAFTSSSSITAVPVTATNGVIPNFISTVTVPYVGSGTTTITVFVSSPTPGQDDAFLVIETPISSPVMASPTASPSAGPFYYIGGSTTTVVAFTGSSSITAIPVTATNGVIPTFVSTVTVPFAGPGSTTITVFVSSPTPGQNSAFLVVETQSGSASALSSTSPAATASTGSVSSPVSLTSAITASTTSYFYIGGTTTTTLTISGSSFITAAPASTTDGVLPNVIATITVPYQGASTVTLTVFTTNPTVGSDDALLVIETPASALSSLASTGGLSGSALTSSASISGILSPSSGSGLAFSSSPSTTVVSVSASSTSTAVSGQPSGSPSAGTLYYIGGQSITTVTLASSPLSVITAIPATITSGVTVNALSTVTVAYPGASTTTITVFKSNPTPGVDDGFLIVETPLPTISPSALLPSLSGTASSLSSGSSTTATVSNAPFYYIGTVITTITLVGTPQSTITALPASGTADVTPFILSTVTAQYDGTTVTTITVFPVSPTPGQDNAFLIVELPTSSSTFNLSPSTSVVSTSVPASGSQSSSQSTAISGSSSVSPGTGSASASASSGPAPQTSPATSSSLQSSQNSVVSSSLVGVSQSSGLSGTTGLSLPSFSTSGSNSLTTPLSSLPFTDLSISLSATANPTGSGSTAASSISSALSSTTTGIITSFSTLR